MGRPGNGESSISRLKDGLYMACYTVQTATGPKRKTIYAKPAHEARITPGATTTSVEGHKQCMLAFAKREPDFSRWCVLVVIAYIFILTHPHPAIRGWLHVSPACPVVLEAANNYALLQYLVPSNKPQGRE